MVTPPSSRHHPPCPCLVPPRRGRAGMVRVRMHLGGGGARDGSVTQAAPRRAVGRRPRRLGRMRACPSAAAPSESGSPPRLTLPFPAGRRVSSLHRGLQRAGRESAAAHREGGRHQRQGGCERACQPPPSPLPFEIGDGRDEARAECAAPRMLLATPRHVSIHSPRHAPSPRDRYSRLGDVPLGT